MKILRLLAMLGTLAAILYYSMGRIKSEPVFPLTPYGELTLIAHAGGGMPGGRYSNSREALDQSARLGFTLIEIDFQTTQNGDLVLMHDWEERHRMFFTTAFSPSRYFPIGRQAKSAEAFTARSMKDGLTPMDLDDLLDWMQANPGVRIVTDIKGDNIAGLTRIRDKAAVPIGRFIPQIYEPSEYDPVRDLGFEDIIFTNYRAKLSPDQLKAFVTDHAVLALTVPLESFGPALRRAAEEAQTPVYVHRFLGETPFERVDTILGAASLKAWGASGIYTDYLHPANSPNR